MEASPSCTKVKPNQEEIANAKLTAPLRKRTDHNWVGEVDLKAIFSFCWLGFSVGYAVAGNFPREMLNTIGVVSPCCKIHMLSQSHFLALLCCRSNLYR